MGRRSPSAGKRSRSVVLECARSQFVDHDAGEASAQHHSTRWWSDIDGPRDGLKHTAGESLVWRDLLYVLPSSWLQNRSVCLNCSNSSLLSERTSAERKLRSYSPIFYALRERLAGWVAFGHSIALFAAAAAASVVATPALLASRRQ